MTLKADTTLRSTLCTASATAALSCSSTSDFQTSSFWSMRTTATSSDRSAILAAVIFNAVIIIALVPLALRGVGRALGEVDRERAGGAAGQLDLAALDPQERAAERLGHAVLEEEPGVGHMLDDLRHMVGYHPTDKRLTEQLMLALVPSLPTRLTAQQVDHGAQRPAKIGRPPKVG